MCVCRRNIAYLRATKSFRPGLHVPRLIIALQLILFYFLPAEARDFRDFRLGDGGLCMTESKTASSPPSVDVLA